jgi:uncharacterized iron-regulated membrane protein
MNTGAEQMIPTTPEERALYWLALALIFVVIAGAIYWWRRARQSMEALRSLIEETRDE